MNLLTIKELIPCVVGNRINRFTVEVFVRGKRSLASINNTGRLNQYLINGMRGYCVKGKRKLKYKLIGIYEDRYAAIIDTKIHEKVFEILVNENIIMKGVKILKRNVRIRSSIIDFLLDNGEYIEIKSAIMRNGECSMYPDAHSERAVKQISDVLSSGLKFNVYFVAGIPEVNCFRINNIASERIYEILRENKDRIGIKAFQIYLDPYENSVKLGRKRLRIIWRRLKANYLKKLEKGIKIYNSKRSPESIARLYKFGPKRFTIEFIGHYCYTCGFYDYFDDFILILEDLGLKVKRTKVKEEEFGAKVEFRITSS